MHPGTVGLDSPLPILLSVSFSAAAAAAAKSLQLCLTLCDPRDGSPPGSPVPGILQARTLERGAMSFSSFLLYYLSYSSPSLGSQPDPIS